MLLDAEREVRDSVSKVASFFAPGSLADKHHEILRLRKAGDTMFFEETSVEWRIILTDHGKELHGKSESLDGAFADMAACLDFLKENHAEDTQVFCSIRAEKESLAYALSP